MDHALEQFIEAFIPKLLYYPLSGGFPHCPTKVKLIESGLLVVRRVKFVDSLDNEHRILLLVVCQVADWLLLISNYIILWPSYYS